MLLLINILTGLLLSASAAANITIPGATADFSASSPIAAAAVAPLEAVIPDVPFYSQFRDIREAQWRKLSCGVASLAMVINFYKPGTVSPDTLLNQGIAAGAYIKDAGWSHWGLISLAKKYGLQGEPVDLSGLNSDVAFARLKKFLRKGPVIASVHYKFEPQNPIPHLVVINGVSGDTVFYNDPAAPSGGKSISAQNFLKAWKKRLISIHS